MSAPGDRREDRLPAGGQIDGEVTVFQPLTVVDISYLGTLVDTPFPLQLDSLHEFRLSLGRFSVVVKGRIAHCRILGLRDGVAFYRSGVEFIEPSEHVRRAIAGFVDALRRSTPEPLVIEGEIAGER